MENLDQFYNSTIGHAYGNYNGGYVGQCVSGGQQILMHVYGLICGPWGNAVDYSPVHQPGDGVTPGTTAVSHLQQSGFEWHTDQNFEDGDLLVWGNDIGSFTGPEGHLAYWYHGKIVSQNYNGNPNFTVKPFFAAGFRGYWRKPGFFTPPAPVAAVPAPQPAPAPAPAPAEFSVGQTVAPNAKEIHDYDGTPIHAWDDAYTLTELKGDRAVLEARGAVWAAVHTADIHHV
jgi:hypothetical protein